MMQDQSKNLKLLSKSLQDLRLQQLFCLIILICVGHERKAKLVKANLQKNVAPRVLLSFHLYKSLHVQRSDNVDICFCVQNMSLDSAGLRRLIIVTGRRTRTLRPLGLLRSVRTIFGAKGREAVAHWQWAWLSSEKLKKLKHIEK